MRYSCIASAALLCAALAAAAQDNAARKNDLDALQGDWQLISVDINGKNQTDDDIKSTRLSFKGDKVVTTVEDKRTSEAAIKVDQSKQPRTIDITPITGGEKGKTQLGIYSLAGDKLIICSAIASDGARPTELKGGKEIVLIVLERAKAKK